MLKNKLNKNSLVSRTKIYLVIIAILLIIMCIYSPKAIIPSIVIYILIIAYTIWADKKRKSDLSRQINELTLSVDKAAQSTIINSPFPLVILETNGSVIWKSSKFIKEFANIDINNYLTDIIKELKQKVNNDENLSEISISEKMEIGNKVYRIIGEYVKIKEKDKKEKDKKSEKEYMATVYFLDETELNTLITKYDQSRISVGIMMIDNYDELMQRVSNEERTVLLSEAEQKIYNWVNTYNGLVIKSERDTFVCIFEQKDLLNIQEQKFSILEDIKEVETPDKVSLTLSIAIAEDGETNFDKYKQAKTMLDIVLGRGGDQAVTGTDGKYTFFGGMTPEVEKYTRVKARTVAQALIKLIQNASNVIIMGHTNADMDSIGSGLGVYRIAKSLGKEAYIVNNASHSNVDNFVKDLIATGEYDEVIIDESEALSTIDENTLLVVTDTDKKNYVDTPELLDETDKIVVIDHHRRGVDHIENAILTFHEVYASSACELVTELLEYSGLEMDIPTIEVEALYAGIMMDTKNFTFKTGVRTFEAAAYLRKFGVDIIRVKKWFQSDMETYNKISEIVANADILYDNIAIAIYDKDDKDVNITCAKAADELLTISNVTASFVLGKVDNKVYISGRSIGDINVQLILEKLGGGGHITVAGAQMENMTIDEVKQELIIRINEYFSELGN